MRHATRISRLACQASGAALGIAHGALFSLGVATVAYIAKDIVNPTAVSYADTHPGKGKLHQQPSMSEMEFLVAELHRAQSDPSVASQPAKGQLAQGLKRTPSASSPRLTRLGLESYDPVASSSGLSPEMERVRDWIASTYRVSDKVLQPALMAAEESAEQHGFDPLLIVAIMAVESSFNPKAVSHMGAQGLMQVIPRYHQDKIGTERGKYALFDPEFNVRVGTLVLQEGLQRYGSLQRALQYYNGALKDPQARYTRKVMAVQKRLHRASGRTDLAQHALLAAAS